MARHERNEYLDHQMHLNYCRNHFSYVVLDVDDLIEGETLEAV